MTPDPVPGDTVEPISDEELAGWRRIASEPSHRVAVDSARVLRPLIARIDALLAEREDIFRSLGVVTAERDWQQKRADGLALGQRRLQDNEARLVAQVDALRGALRDAYRPGHHPDEVLRLLGMTATPPTANTEGSD